MSTDATSGRLLTVPETARLLRLHRSSIYRLVREGELPAVRVGHSLRIDRDELQGYIYGEGTDAQSEAGPAGHH